MMTPQEFDAMLGQLYTLEAQVQAAIRVLSMMRPGATANKVEDRAPRERVHKTFGGEHRVPIDPDEVARAATAPATREGYISDGSQGDTATATSGKADGSAE